METPDLSESSPSGTRSTNASVSSDGNPFRTAKMVLEFVEDVPAELAEYVRLGKFGMFKEASRVFDDLKRHLGWFPIAAEHCGLLLDKGDFRALEEFVDKTTPSKGFSKQQEQLLSLFKSLAKLHTQDCVSEALAEARNAARHVDGTAMENLTATQMQMIILRLQIFDLARRISPQLVFTDFWMLLVNDATTTGIPTFVQHLLHKDHFWKARSLLGAYIRMENSDDEKLGTIVQQFLARPERSDSSKEALVLAKVAIAVAFCEGLFHRLSNDETAIEVETAVYNEAQKIVRRHEEIHALASSRPVGWLSILDTDKAVLQAASGTISGTSISFDVLKKIEARAHQNDDISLQQAVQLRVGGFLEVGVVEEREWLRNKRLQSAYQELIQRSQKYSGQIIPLDSQSHIRSKEGTHEASRTIASSDDVSSPATSSQTQQQSNPSIFAKALERYTIASQTRQNSSSSIASSLERGTVSSGCQTTSTNTTHEWDKNHNNGLGTLVNGGFGAPKQGAQLQGGKWVENDNEAGGLLVNGDINDIERFPLHSTSKNNKSEDSISKPEPDK